ncbi:hypothetical protein CSE16_10925 [Solibacillus sp. R5-41]|uniref:DUF2332 domain-containing protein n=1 Tax=Solibacillus sp. R5-41 TaxID=2048654 RepID=UPI000C1289C0|nr:DUF2332 domain-containing protein [Solibacillus sp. R5-41]ATP40519.1 hypothetical protein CSE16_10925 [Solibacillus sp. R5-41]
MERLAMIFTRFAKQEAKGSSPLYEYWSLKIAQDIELLTLVQFIPPNQPKPNLFFAAVQYLAHEKNHPLADYFNQVSSGEFAQSFRQLQDFCKQYRAQLKVIFQTKLVQTNELNRAAYLYPIFSTIQAKSQKPLSLIEIGSSAGLLLNVDQYCYEIEEAGVKNIYGNENSKVHIFAENTGQPIGALSALNIDHRVGIDLNIVDLQNDEDSRWMQALIWPEHKMRKQQLENVQELNSEVRKTLLEGDFLSLIPKIMEQQDKTTQFVIFHTHVANQFSKELKQQLLHMLNELSFKQPIYHVYNNMDDNYVHVDYVRHGQTQAIRLLQTVDNHGKYFKWN